MKIEYEFYNRVYRYTFPNEDELLMNIHKMLEVDYEEIAAAHIAAYIKARLGMEYDHNDFAWAIESIGRWHQLNAELAFYQKLNGEQ